MATEIIKSIGATARDYTNAITWEADIPDFASVDEAWIGEVYNDAEITGTATTSISGHNPTALRFIKLIPASGEGFADGMSGSDPLIYDASKGASFRNTSGTNVVFDISDDFVFIHQLQIKHDSSDCISVSADDSEIRRCICVGQEGSANYTGVISTNGDCLIVNSLIVSTQSGDYAGIAMGFGSGGGTTVDCTVLHPSDVGNTDNGVDEYYGDDNVVKGTASFGYTDGFDNNDSWGTGSDWNASDDATGPGANTLDNETYGDQFENTTAASMDARLKSGSNLLAAGITNSESGGVDILGTNRDGTNPNIGCWEAAAAVSGRIMSSLAGSGGLAYHGGIAGKGGGLAG